MKTKVLENDKESLHMLIMGSEPALANAIRRTIVAEVPVMAIDSVNVYENSSVAFDEYIMHRLGLIPLTTDLKTYKAPEDCCGGNCASCSVELTIDESGPKMVYTSDMKTADAKVKPVSGKIPIIELNEGERLHVECKAVLGRGEDHVKWQAGNAAYRYLSKIELLKGCDNCGDCAKVCPKGALKKGKTKIITDELLCNACGLCVERCGKDTIKVTQDKKSFLFNVESNGQLSPGEMITQAVEIVDKKIQSLKELVK